MVGTTQPTRALSLYKFDTTEHHINSCLYPSSIMNSLTKHQLAAYVALDVYRAYIQLAQFFSPSAGETILIF